MDTNVLLRLLEARESSAGLNNTTLALASLIVSFLTPLVGATVIWLQNQSIKQKVLEVHSEVNSKSTAMIQKGEAQEVRIVDLSKQVSSLEQMLRSTPNQPHPLSTTPIDTPVPVKLEEVSPAMLAAIKSAVTKAIEKPL